MTRFALPLMMAALLLPTAAKAEMTPDQTKDVEAIVKNYILNNPAILIESVNKFQQEQQAKQAKAEEEKYGPKVKELAEKLKTEKMGAVAGNPDGDVVLVEFFDYNCGWCKKALTEIQSLLKDDKNVRIIFFDLPVLGEDSTEVAKWSLASKKQGKYFEFHQAVMAHPGGHDEATLRKLSAEAGLDADKLAKDKDSPEIMAEINKHIEIAQSVGVQGTPGFMIGDQIFRGYVPYDAMQAAIKAARAQAASTKK